MWKIMLIKCFKGKEITNLIKFCDKLLTSVVVVTGETSILQGKLIVFAQREQEAEMREKRKEEEEKGKKRSEIKFFKRKGKW